MVSFTEAQDVQNITEFDSIWTGYKGRMASPDPLTGKTLGKPRSREILRGHHRRVVNLAHDVAIAKEFGYTVKVSMHIFEMYPPCTTWATNLLRTYLPDLLINDHNEGRYVLVRTVTCAVTLGAMLTIVEDEKGNWEQLAINCYDHLHSGEDFLPKGSILMIRHPYFKHTPNSAFFIVVDHITDLTIVLPMSAIIPKEWAPPSKTAEEWYDEGCAHLLDGKYYRAVHCFGCAVHVASYLGTSKPDTERDARVGRSKAYNKICIWEKALFDAQLASSLKNCADATIQASLAQYHLQNIPTAVNLLIRSGCFPRDHLFLDVLLEKAFERRCESKGIFSLRKLKDRRWNGERMECHDYTELVKCRGAGKGVWFKDDIKEIVPGQLVLVTRAWASCSPEESRIFGLYDHSKGKTVKGNLLTLARRVAEKCSNNPNSFGMDLLENLGLNKGYQGLRELRTVDGKAVIDTFAIYQSIYEACGDVGACLGDIESGDSDLSDSKATAFFDLVPTIKTACWPNCFARQIGDIVVIHATRHISGGQEMTIAKEDDLDLSECRANDGSGCECPLHEAENLQRPERIKTKRTILERLICGMGTDVKHNVLDQFGRFQIWDKILAELDEAYSDVPRGMPKVVKAQACLLMVNFITEKGKDREAIAKQVILAELGLECLGYRYDVKSEEPKILKYGVMCSQALTFMEIAAQGSQALQESNANAYSWMLKKLWTIFYAADSSELDTDAVVCSAR